MLTEIPTQNFREQIQMNAKETRESSANSREDGSKNKIARVTDTLNDGRYTRKLRTHFRE